MPRLSARRLAGLSALFNLPFVLLQAQRGAYDTDTHIFLADHYRRAWFSLWETRWYMGFSMASYPPLVHQLIALISWPVGWAIRFFAPGPEAYPGAFVWVAEETGFVLLLLAALALLPLAARVFARQFFGSGVANVTALLTVFLPAVSLAAWSFGQLPTLLATGVVLLALARGAAFARTGRPLYLAQAVALAAVAGAAHHGVFLLVPFAGAAVAGRVLITAPGAGTPGAGARSWRRPALRLALWGALSGVAVAAVLWPFLLWSRGQQLQTAIDHASRDNFLTGGPAAVWYFFWPMYGPLLLAVPLGIWLGRRSRAWRRRWPLLLVGVVLFVAGLGGTTPLPRWLFGAGWVWLTYDRFAFWAALLLLPFAALALAWLWRRRRWGRRAAVAFLAAMILWAIGAGWLAVLSRAQPPEINLGSLAVFLEQPAQQPYRYFTLGFGDQLAKLSALAPNGTPDGDYHTARSLPELRASGLGALDGAVWNPQGVAAARPFLANAARYGAKWAFVAHPAYLPLLRATGWKYYSNDGPIEIWQHPDVEPVPALPPTVPGGQWAANWWGVAPLSALLLALVALAGERARAPSRAALLTGLGWLRRAGWVLTMALLGLWWMRVLRPGSTPNAYFTYDSVIVYAADLGAALTLAVWLLERVLRRERLRFGPRAVGVAGLALIAATALSALHSVDPALSGAVAAQVVLAAGWYWLLVNDAPEATLAGRVLSGWLAAQALVVLVEVALQNTTWLRGLYLPWPGQFTAPMPGASVVQNGAGARWLRGYGTLPHPNTLGGFLLLGLGAVLERYTATGRRIWLVAVALAAAALVLTFSRASWLGAGVLLLGAAGWYWHYARPRWPRYRQALLILALAGGLSALPLLPWLVIRADFSDQAVSTETRSLQERELYTLVGLRMLAGHPWVGIGAGTFVEVLAGLVPPLTRLEPVHNVLLLVTTETGLLGGMALLGLGAAIAWRAWQRRRAAAAGEVLWALVLIGMGVTGLFDHYWWTAPPGRLAFATVLGLWAAAASAGHVPAHDQVALDARGEALSGLQADAHIVGADGGV